MFRPRLVLRLTTHLNAASVLSLGLMLPLFSLPSQATEATTVYFSQFGSGWRLNRMPVSGGAVEVLEEGESFPFGVDVDVTGGMVYMASPSTDAVYRRALDGSGSPELLIDGLVEPIDIALDVQRDSMYFTDRGNGAIKRANLDGTDSETLVADLVNVFNLEIDL